MRSLRGKTSRDRWPRVAGAVVVVLVATGCGPGVASDQGAVASASLARAGPHCPTTAKLPAPQGERPMPAGFVTAWVLRCGGELRSVAGQGKWWFRIEERADTDAAALVAALRRPDEHAPPGTVCADVGFALPYFALVDASGTVVRPRVPRDGCGGPQRQVVDALRNLPFHQTAAIRVSQEQSQESIDTGCGQMWTDAFAGDTLAHTRPAASRRMWQKTPEAVLVCLWRSAQRGMPQLVSAGTVSGRELAALLARLDRLPAAEPCTPRHDYFVVLQYIRRGWDDSAVYAEIDHCRLVLRPDHTLGQLDPATAELLTALSHR